MDKTSEIINNFETILKEKSNRQLIALYGSNQQHSSRASEAERPYKAQDVLTNISKQIQAIQNADCVKRKNDKYSLGNMTKYKKSSFLPVNMLPRDEEVPQQKTNINKFDTQCVSDTQLINIVEDVEAIVDTHKGMTQEFETSFYTQVDIQDADALIEKDSKHHTDTDSLTDDKETKDLEIEPRVNIIDISLKEPDPYKHTNDINVYKVSEFNEAHDVENKTENARQHYTQEINENFEIEEDMNQVVMIVDTDLPPSPVFDIKPTVVQAKTPSPLVFNLDSFERFEKIAVPVVGESLDLETAKHLINSQILEKELFIQSDWKPLILNKSKKSSQSSNALNDEILFSSDEEEFINQDFQDLPMTCALETSFYEQSDILDKTMFVGFQTASNKSIQVCTESFSKAKNLLDNVDEKEPTLTELVEICDSLNSKQEINFQNNSNKTKECFTKNKQNNSDVDLIKNNDSYDSNLIGFRTANEKSIDVSNEALIKSKGFFEDINTLTNDNDIAKLPTTNTMEILQVSTYADSRTATNKMMKLSDIALATSKRVFDNIYSDNIKNKEMSECHSKLLEDIKNKISNTIVADLENTDSIPNDIEETRDSKIDDTILNELENVMSQEFVGEQVEFRGFKTASDKNIKISGAALAKTKQIFQDIDFTENIVLTCNEAVQMEGKLSPKKINLRDNSEHGKLTDLGFKTASNKEVKISEQARARTKRIFHDIEVSGPLDDDNILETEHIVIQGIFDQPSNSEASYTGFKTANNKEIKISEEAFSKTKSIFQDIEKVDYQVDKIRDSTPLEKSRTSEIRVNEFGNELAHNNIQGFDNNDSKGLLNAEECILTSTSLQVASVNSKTPEGSLTKTKNIFKDKYLNDQLDQASAINPVFHGFRTASKKPVTISAEAIAKSKVILQDIDQLNQDLDKIDAFSNYFQTACKKPAAISTHASSKSKFISQNTTHDMLSNIKGFHTASNKPIEISKGALAKSRNIFADIDNYNDEYTNPIEKNEKVNTDFQGFQTASNKTVKISDEALLKSRKILEDIDDCKQNYISFKGFQTASNKAVKISDEALAKSREIFRDIDEENLIANNKNSAVAEFQGFQMANNKIVKIPEETLPKTRNIFQGDITGENLDDIQNTKSFKGFQTASYKPVKISKEALAKSRKIFEEVDKSTENFVDDEKVPFRGFQTANNKNVKVSGQALAKAKQLFGDNESECKNFRQIENKVVKDLKNTSKNDVNVVENKLSSAKYDDCKSKSANINKNNIPDKVSQQSRQLISVSNISENNSDSKTLYDDLNVENIINTQVLNNFEESMHTEDFCKVTTPIKTSKRSGSPILSCPKAKRRKKFETPYSQRHINIQKDKNVKHETNPNQKPENIIKFEINYKKNKKFNLKDVEKLEKETLKTKIILDPYILNFNLENILTFEFFGIRNDLNDLKWTINDIKKNFLNSVNKKLIPEGWLDNHLKLIMWKLISYEVKFPNAAGVVCSTRNVIEQLKYRYDRELFNAERPALRKIMEKDDSSSRMLVLCVAGIFEDGVNVCRVTNPSNSIELLLTDGWYCIKATIDKMLANLVRDGKISVGSKIVTHGAELVNCEGVSPWEDTSSIRLKIFGNSTRRARWDARLGYHSNTAILSQLSSVKPEGGKVSKLRAFVTRVYPTLYIEKFGDGSTVTRSERLEHLHQVKHEAERQVQLEKLYEEVEKEFSDQGSQDSDVSLGSKRRCLDSGSQIAKAMKTSKDPMEFRSHLTESQSLLLHEHTTRQRERLLHDIQKRVQDKIAKNDLHVTRNVVPLLKIRIAGVEERNGGVEVTRAMMSIWKPTDAVIEMIKEGSWIEVLNVVPTAVRYADIQISAGRQSVFRHSKYKESEKIKPYTRSMKRTCYTVKDLVKNPAITTEYSEIDTVGFIFLIDPSIKFFDSNKHQFQNMYLADADKNIICVNFWGGLKKFGFENVLDTGQIVTGMNLQKRAGNTRKNIPQYRVTEFSYFTKTPKHENARQMVEDLNKKFTGVDNTKFCEDCINLKNNYSVIKFQNYNENVSPYRFQNIDINLSKNKIFIDSPLTHRNQKIDDNLNLSGLDFESTFKQTDTQDLSPKTLLRKQQVKEKIAKLKMYGEPPALSPIQILNKSKDAGKAYKNPLVPKSTIPSSVVSEERNVLNENKTVFVNDDLQRSPIMMNKTYVKRSNVNPVKLNFSNIVAIDENADVDHIAEDFDDSPPLSLD